jgi:hypothetical protein
MAFLTLILVVALMGSRASDIPIIILRNSRTYITRVACQHHGTFRIAINKFKTAMLCLVTTLALTRHDNVICFNSSKNELILPDFEGKREAEEA